MILTPTETLKWQRSGRERVEILTAAMMHFLPVIRRPGLRWLVLAFTCAWFGVLVPVHQRGQIRLPGDASAATCCPTEKIAQATGVAACHRTQEPADAPRGLPADNCAVCFFIATLDLPSPVLLDVPPLAFALPPPPLRDPITPVLPPPFRPCLERGPPQV